MKRNVLWLILLLVALSGDFAGAQSPDDLIFNGTVRINGGEGIVFPDGSIQGTAGGPAPDLSAYYTKAQVDGLLAALSATIPHLPANGLTATSSGTTMTLLWNAVPGATGYNLYWGTAPGLTASSSRFANLAGTTYQQPGLTPGATYHYAVSALYPSGEGPLSAEVSRSIPTSCTTPNAPREGEPNNTLQSATIYTPGLAGINNCPATEIRGQLYDDTDKDYYSFFVNAPSVVKFSVSSDNTNPAYGLRLRILYADGTTVLSGSRISDTPVELSTLCGAFGVWYYFVVDKDPDKPIFQQDYRFTATVTPQN